MICPNCGCDNESGVKYCVECGTKLPMSFSDCKPEKEEVKPVENTTTENNTLDKEDNTTQGSTYNYENFDTSFKNNAYTYDYNEEEEYKDPGYTFGLASFILAIVALIIGCCCCTCISCFQWIMIILEITAVVLGIVSLVKKERKKAFPIIGIVIAGLLLLSTCSNKVLNYAGRLGNAIMPNVQYQYTPSQYDLERLEDFTTMIEDYISDVDF